MLTSRTWVAAALAVGLYASVAVAGKATALGEVFPFYAWDLFTVVPGEIVRPTLYLHAVDGVVLEPPQPLFETPHVRGSKVVISKLADRLADAIVRDPDRAAELRRGLEANHLTARTEWALTVERYEPIARWNSGEVRDLFEIARFATHGDPCERYRLAATALHIGGHALPIAARPGGVVEEVGVDDRFLRLEGWAGDADSGALPQQLVVVAGGRCVHLGGVGLPRPDRAAATGRRELRWSGFRLLLAREVAEGPAAPEVLAVFDDGTVRRVARAEGGGAASVGSAAPGTGR